MFEELYRSYDMNILWLKIIDLSLNCALGLFVFFIFFLFATFLPKIILKVSYKIDKSHSHIYDILSKIIRLAILVIGVITAIGTAGVNVSALIASLGLTGFALGFALKDSLSNTLAGFIILFYKPFEISDHVNILGKDGTVVSIDLRYTTLQAKEQRILIPNSSMLSTVVIIYEDSNS